MNHDRKMFRWLGLLLILPIILSVCGGDRFRYPCQDPENWGEKQCQKPYCEVTGTCPEHIFKGSENPPAQITQSKPIDKGCK